MIQAKAITMKKTTITQRRETVLPIRGIAAISGTMQSRKARRAMTI
jgi:hypothetical protein